MLSIKAEIGFKCNTFGVNVKKDQAFGLRPGEAKCLALMPGEAKIFARRLRFLPR